MRLISVVESIMPPNKLHSPSCVQPKVSIDKATGTGMVKLVNRPSHREEVEVIPGLNVK